jgi:hypothetical protein
LITLYVKDRFRCVLKRDNKIRNELLEAYQYYIYRAISMFRGEDSFYYRNELHNIALAFIQNISLDRRFYFPKMPQFSVLPKMRKIYMPAMSQLQPFESNMRKIYPTEILTSSLDTDTITFISLKNTIVTPPDRMLIMSPIHQSMANHQLPLISNYKKCNNRKQTQKFKKCHR